MAPSKEIKDAAEPAKKWEEGRLEEIAHNIDVEVRYDVDGVRSNVAKARQHGPHAKGKHPAR